MNTPSNAMRDSFSEPRAAAAAVIPPSQHFYWSVRREFWENRSLYIAPLGVGALVVAGFLIGAIHLPAKMHAASALGPMQQHALIERPYIFAELSLMGCMIVVAAFYCLDSLHGERRDRSILFWKSLPVSDVTTVLAKACIPILILPLVTFVITLATQWIMLLLNSAVLLAAGLNPSPPWTQLMWIHRSVGLLYHLMVIHGLWYAPFYGWLLLVSAWARHAAFLWAVLPPLAIGAVEKIAFNSSHFGALLQQRFAGGPEGAALGAAGMSTDPLVHINPGQFLTSPGMWLGLIVTAAFLAAAMRLRRYRDPM